MAQTPCQSCKEQPATIHLTEIVDGEKRELHYCEDCAHKEGINPLAPHSFFSPFAEAAPLFVLNVLDFAILLLVRPAESTYHGLRKPWLEWIQRGAVLPVLVLFGWLLGPRFGAHGMIWTQIIGGIAALVAAAFLLRGRLDSTPTTEPVSKP